MDKRQAALVRLCRFFLYYSIEKKRFALYNTPGKLPYI